MQLQAFIFCGGGHNLSPFSSSTLGTFSDGKEQDDTDSNNNDNKDTKNDKDVNGNGESDAKDSAGFDINDSVITATGHLPKALLPIANRAMIEYVIDWCDQADFNEINIVAHKDEIDIIKYGLAEFLKLRSEQFKMIEAGLHQNIHSHHIQTVKKINFITTTAPSMGETLISDLLPLVKMDFVLLPCDFITDIPPQIFIDQYHNRDDDNLAISVFYKNSVETTLDKKKLKQDQIFTVYNDDYIQESQRQPVLLDIYSQENVTKTKYLQIRSHLLWKYPNTTVSTKLFNSSIYLCSYELCQFLTKPRETVDNATGNTSGGNEDGDNDDDNVNSNAIQPSYFKHNDNKLIPDPINTKTTLSKLFRDLARRSWRHVQEKRETIGIFILPDPALATFIRANNLATLIDANRFVLRIKSTTSTLMTSSSAIGADALVDPSTILGEKSSVKLTTIRNNCQIGSKCRISGSIILDGAIIEDECILENVIVGPNARIGKKSKLTNSYVEGNFEVEPKSMVKGETLMKIIEDDEFDEDGYAIYSGSDDDIDHLSSDAVYSSGDDSGSSDDYHYSSDGSFDGDDDQDFFAH